MEHQYPNSQANHLVCGSSMYDSGLEVSVPNLLDEETAYLVFSAVYSKNFLSLFIAFKLKGSGMYVCIPNLSEMEFPTLVISVMT